MLLSRSPFLTVPVAAAMALAAGAALTVDRASAQPSRRPPPPERDPYGGPDGLQDPGGYGGVGYGGVGYGGVGYGGLGYGIFDDGAFAPTGNGSFDDGVLDARGYGVLDDGGLDHGGAGYDRVAGAAAPALLAVTASQIVRFDRGPGRTLFTMPTTGPGASHAYQAIVADEATGRWAITRQAVRFPGDRAAPWSVLFGAPDGSVREVAGDPACGTPRLPCFEELAGFVPGQDAILARSLTRKGTTLGRYQFGRRGRTALAGRAMGTVFALSPAQDRAAYASRGGVTIVSWPLDGAPRGARPQRLRVAGTVQALALTATGLYVEREDRRGTTLEHFELATGRWTTVRGARHLGGWQSTNARGTVLVHDCPRPEHDENRCDLVELAGPETRVVARALDHAWDVSADGRFVLASRSARRGEARGTRSLVAIDLATGADAAVYPDPGTVSAQFTR